MKFSVIIAPRADEDFREIALWIAHDSPANAEQWLDDVLSVIDSLSMFSGAIPPRARIRAA